MTSESDELELDGDEPAVEELTRLSREAYPPPMLEALTVARLRAVGLLRPPPWPWARRAWLLGAAAPLLLLAIPLVQMVKREEPPNYALLLYGGQPAALEQRAAEYRRWTRTAASGARVLNGDALARGGDVVSPTPAGGIEVVRLDVPWDVTMVGYFLVRARSVTEAVELAKQCPHLRYGGSIVVRPIAPS